MIKVKRSIYFLMCVMALTGCQKTDSVVQNPMVEKGQEAEKNQKTPTPTEEVEKEEVEAPTEESQEEDSSSSIIHQMDKEFKATTGSRDGIAAVQDLSSGLWGYIDETGSYVIEPIYYGAYPFSEGMAAVNIDGNWGFIDIEGNLVIEPMYQSIYFRYNNSPVAGFEDEYAFVKLDSKYVLINKKGELVREIDWREGRKKDNQRYTLNRTISNSLSECVDCEVSCEEASGYNYTQKYHLMCNREDNKQIYIMDENGKIIVNINQIKGYDEKNCFVEGITEEHIFVKRIINKITTMAVFDYKGNVLIDYRYKYLGPLQGEKFVVANRADDSSVLLDMSGQEIRNWSKGYFVVAKYNEPYGYASIWVKNEDTDIRTVEILDAKTGEIIFEVPDEYKKSHGEDWIFTKKCAIGYEMQEGGWGTPGYASEYKVFNNKGEMLLEAKCRTVNREFLSAYETTYHDIRVTMTGFYKYFLRNDLKEKAPILFPLDTENGISFVVIQ